MDQGPGTPVIVVGAGPTGLTLAVALRLHGVPVRLVDRATEPAPISKALGVWSGSLEAMAGLGVAETFLNQARRLKAMKVGDGKRLLTEITIGAGIDSPYPYPILLPQSRTEAILAARADELGVTVERGVELVGLHRHPYRVEAVLRHAEGRDETVETPYLIGADGARSFVRHALGIAFDGYTEPRAFLLGDAPMAGGDLDPLSIYLWWHDGGTVALFPFENGIWRMIAARDDATNEAAPSREELQEKLARHGPRGVLMGAPTWLATFRINERLAASYRIGRVFLAGDAAHIHSPAGGQGMNTGMQDATNLAWKLALALRGRGDAEILLDSYEAERRPVGRAVIADAAQKLHAAFAGGVPMAALRNLLVSTIGRLPVVQKRLQVQLSETEIVYRSGPLVALAPASRPVRRGDVGTRALDVHVVDPASGASSSLWPVLSGPHHSLILFEDAAAAIDVAAIADRLGPDLVVIRLGPGADPEGSARRRYWFRAPGWVLIRPDQVIAARGAAGDLALLVRYLDHVLAPAVA